jgi:hypothetical protein
VWYFCDRMRNIKQEFYLGPVSMHDREDTIVRMEQTRAQRELEEAFAAFCTEMHTQSLNGHMGLPGSWEQHTDGPYLRWSRRVSFNEAPRHGTVTVELMAQLHDEAWTLDVNARVIKQKMRPIMSTQGHVGYALVMSPQETKAFVMRLDEVTRAMEETESLKAQIRYLETELIRARRDAE